MKSLSELISENIFSTDKNNLHSYVDYFYEKEFSKYREKQITLVELGVFHGGSIRLWDSYFSNAILYALDDTVKNKSFENFCNSKDNINYLVGNAYLKNVADQVPEYDIFIEDGSHFLTDQMKAIALYLPKMKDDGVFIVEDVEEFKNLKILKNFTQSLFSGYTFEFIDLRIVKYRYDDLMLIIRKEK